MRAYNVKIKAELNGKEIYFTEVIAFPLEHTGIRGCVKEAYREAGAIEQVRIKYPQLKKIKALSSIHVDYGRNKAIQNYVPLPNPRRLDHCYKIGKKKYKEG